MGILIVHGFVISPLFFGLVTSSVRAYKIPTQSMSQTLEIGDKVIADMKAYRGSTPARGDLVVFKWPKNESVSYVKRVIGMPGETLEIRNRVIYIDGKPLKEGYALYLDPRSVGDHWGPYRIPGESYIVLGDSRDNSQDSRYWGPVKQSQILGQARYLYWAKNRSRIGKKIK